MQHINRLLIGLFSLSILILNTVPVQAHCNVTGSWSATTGVTLSLSHNGNSVAGTFSPGGGSISGGYGGGVWSGGWSGGGDSGGFSVVFDTSSCSSFGGSFTENGLEGSFSWAGERISGGNRAPTVSMGMTPIEPTTTDTIEFVATADDPDGDELTYQWFLDGAQQNAVSNTVTWGGPSPGDHTIRVVVFDEHDRSDESSIAFHVSGASASPIPNSPPTVSLGMTPQNPTTSDTVKFSASASDPDDDPLTYTWFIDGVQQNASAPGVDWPTPPAGNHTARVVVDDGQGGSDEASISFTVGGANEDPIPNSPPTVSLGMAPQNPTTFDTIKFSANASDPDDDPLTYKWFIDGVQQNSSTPGVDWVAPPAGNHTARVVVDDGKGGSNEASISFTVTEASCRAQSVIESFNLILPQACPIDVPPRILSVDIAPSWNLGQAQTWAVVFEDQDGDPDILHYEWCGWNASNQSLGCKIFDFPLSSSFRNSLGGSFPMSSGGCTIAGTLKLSVWMSDRAGNASNTLQATLTCVAVGPTMKPSLRSDLDKLATELALHAKSAGMMAAFCASKALIDPSIFSKLCAVAGGLYGATTGLLAASIKFAVSSAGTQSARHIHSLMADSNFKQIATPQVKTFTPLSGEDAATESMASAMNELIRIQLQMLAYSDALGISIQRAQGAVAAGDTDWINKQTEAVQTYSDQLTGLMKQLADLNIQLQNTWQSAGLTATTISKENFKTIQAEIQQNGLPEEITAVFKELNVPASEVQAFEDAILAQNPDDLPEGFIEGLDDPALTGDLKKVANDLGDFSDSVDHSGSAFPQPSPSPGNGGSIAAALDGNGNGTLEQSEVQKGIQYWIMGETVPGTDQTISDAMMRELIQMWILGTPVNQSANASQALTYSTTLSVQGMKLVSINGTQRQVQLDALNISSVQVDVFDLQGRIITQASNGGRKVRFDLLDANLHPLPNGVYLYVVSATGFSGERWRSEVRKFALLR